MEEDIKTLEKYLEYEINSLALPERQALENLIEAYKELKEIEENHRKENGKLRKKVKELEEENQQLEAIKDEAIRRYNLESIPTSLVEEKIEEINKAYEDSKDENGESQYYYPDYTIRVLEELLEKRK